MDDQRIEKKREKRTDKLSALQDYKNNYDIDMLMVDLLMYFEGEIDFNLERMRQVAQQPGKLLQLIQKAKQNDTHPAVELVGDIFKDLI